MLVLFVSNSRLKAIFGRGEIATDVPLLLFGLILFATWRINRRAANRQNELLGRLEGQLIEAYTMHIRKLGRGLTFHPVVGELLRVARSVSGNENDPPSNAVGVML
ncbi:hypothetical protein [Sphingomonas faeni]|uniref:hypothetical protein n=1 Tax=Sphingomonas faeni TaxID=185950 RepID=UPI0020BECE41|nr:hypothetical protein [Sphingomonas faeni]MCK8458444.1 hypothetical protein [Sphingomonas faeni]